MAEKQKLNVFDLEKLAKSAYEDVVNQDKLAQKVFTPKTNDVQFDYSGKKNDKIVKDKQKAAERNSTKQLRENNVAKAVDKSLKKDRVSKEERKVVAKELRKKVRKNPSLANQDLNPRKLSKNKELKKAINEIGKKAKISEDTKEKLDKIKDPKKAQKEKQELSQFLLKTGIISKEEVKKAKEDPKAKKALAEKIKNLDLKKLKAFMEKNKSKSTLVTKTNANSRQLDPQVFKKLHDKQKSNG